MGKENPELAKKWDAYWNHKATGECESPSYKAGDKLATRDASGKSLNCMAKRYEWLVGGSADLQGPNKTKVATISKDKIREIAEMKMPDLNAGSVEAAMSMIAGTARSMGITVEE